MVIIPLALLIFRLDEKYYIIPVIALGFVSLAVAFYVPGRIDLGGWYQPYDAETNSTMLMINVLEAAGILLLCFYIIVKENQKRVLLETKARKLATKREAEMTAQAQVLEKAKEAAEEAEKKANNTTLELMTNKAELVETLEQIKNANARWRRKTKNCNRAMKSCARISKSLRHRKRR